MSGTGIPRVLRALLLGAALLLPGGAAAAQGATAVIEGRVTDVANGRGLENVQVSVDGTQLGGLTNAQGNFRITGVPVAGARRRRWSGSGRWGTTARRGP